MESEELPKRKRVASYLVRVVLYDDNDHETVTNADLENIVGAALAQAGWTDPSVNSERLDK
jgi:hypothetical protein